MTNQQGAPEALRCAEWLEHIAAGRDVVDIAHLAATSAAELRRLAALVEAQQPAPSAAAAGGLPIAQEPKYTVTGAHIVNRATGEAVPHDEPVFVFRARDALGVRALDAYLALIGEREPSSAHADAVRGRIADFRRFAAIHPERMKWPDTDPTPQADSQPAPVEELDEDACRCEPSDYVRPADYDGDGSVAAMARRAARAPAESVGRDAERLAWMADGWTPGHEKLYVQHVLETGGLGDVDDLRTFIDKQMAANGGNK